jgi:hypothetical protein
MMSPLQKLTALAYPPPVPAVHRPAHGAGLAHEYLRYTVLRSVQGLRRQAGQAEHARHVPQGWSAEFFINYLSVLGDLGGKIPFFRGKQLMENGNGKSNGFCCSVGEERGTVQR